MTATVSIQSYGDELSLLDRVSKWTMASRSLGFRWTFALAAFAITTAACFAIERYLPTGFPFLTFFPAVLFTAYFAGILESVVIAGLCLIVAWVAFIPPFYSAAVSSSHLLAVFLYTLVVATEIGLVYLMRHALLRMTQAEAAAREMAQAKTLMFAELQHRVSNNLAVVGSLLSLQRREVKDPASVRALDEAAVRVNVVSRLSRLLHDPEAQEIDFGAFLRAMVPDAVAAAGVGDRISVEVAVESVHVSARKAVPLGLVATELLSNALEHAFPDGRRGTVRVSLEATRDGLARLTIRDDGVGLPKGFDLDRTRSLGLVIARQFAGQLGADLTVAEGGGVVSRVDVPLGD